MAFRPLLLCSCGGPEVDLRFSVLGEGRKLPTTETSAPHHHCALTHSKPLNMRAQSPSVFVAESTMQQAKRARKGRQTGIRVLTSLQVKAPTRPGHWDWQGMDCAGLPDPLEQTRSPWKPAFYPHSEAAAASSSKVNGLETISTSGEDTCCGGVHLP